MNKFAPTPKFNFTWSKIKNYETCPRRYLEIDVLKHFRDESPQLDYGNDMHDAAKKRILKKVPFPKKFEVLEEWIQKFTKDSDPGTIQVELKLALDKNLKPCSWLDKRVYFRGIIDFLKIYKNVALVVDWKSGEPKDDLVQLGLFAQLVFSNYDFIKAVRTMYVWAKTNDSTEEILYKKDMKDLWIEINPRVQKLETAHRLDQFPPKKSGLCKAHCPVLTCEYNGR